MCFCVNAPVRDSGWVGHCREDESRVTQKAKEKADDDVGEILALLDHRMSDSRLVLGTVQLGLDYGDRHLTCSSPRPSSFLLSPLFLQGSPTGSGSQPSSRRARSSMQRFRPGSRCRKHANRREQTNERIIKKEIGRERRAEPVEGRIDYSIDPSSASPPPQGI